jgi:hypothetical protein
LSQRLEAEERLELPAHGDERPHEDADAETDARV